MTRLKERFRSLSLYHKFALAIFSLGLFPVMLIFPFLLHKAVQMNMRALEENYRQAVNHVSSTVENAFSSYDTASQIMYHYNGMDTDSILHIQYENYDNLRKILSGEIPGIHIEREMDTYLRTVSAVDSYIYAVHFVAGEEVPSKEAYHYSPISTYFKGEEEFSFAVPYGELDRESRKLLLSCPHGMSYYAGIQGKAFTVGRNYFDIRGAVGTGRYVGTVLMDVSLERLDLLFRQMDLKAGTRYFLLDAEQMCYYSSEKELIGQKLTQEELSGAAGRGSLLFSSKENRYGLQVLFAVNKRDAFASIRTISVLVGWLIVAVLLVLLGGAGYFSRRMTGPIYEMMGEMKKVEAGDFDIHLPVRSNDELGSLAQSFNEMSRELENYINQAYVAKLRQNEAELTALKSQIYPHFLYNTLEVIRMTALENADENVAAMIEALSEQIHYLIGPVGDRVPLQAELDIVKKYVYLLNCRIRGKLTLSIEAEEGLNPLIPKLVLQPVVENAYVHGLKPKSIGERGVIGSIQIEVLQEGNEMEIDVMDNGVGIDQEGVEKIEALFESKNPGIKNEYNWQSIGLKNVHDRIRYLYGSEYGVRITSTVGIGTVVQLRFPLEEGKGGEERDENGDCR